MINYTLENYGFGNYGFLPQGKMKNQPLILLDLGVKHRCRESYCFDNTERRTYRGYLLQYTLKGRGIYEAHEFRSEPDTVSKARPSCRANDAALLQKTSVSYPLAAGKGFFSRMPEESRYYLPFEEASAENCCEEWEFFYFAAQHRRQH